MDQDDHPRTMTLLELAVDLTNGVGGAAALDKAIADVYVYAGKVGVDVVTDTAGVAWRAQLTDKQEHDIRAAYEAA